MSVQALDGVIEEPFFKVGRLPVVLYSTDGLDVMISCVVSLLQFCRD
jgi:hypothetical protein